MSPEKMVHMANQIATFFDSQPGDAAEKIAEHLQDFWSPPMREQLQGYIAAGGGGLNPSVEEAARKL